MSKSKNPARRIAFSGLMLALAIALSFFESSLPSLPILLPGAKLGLSNIVTMYAVFFLGAARAFTIAVLKSLFVLLTRGATGAFLSLLGGLLSVLVMLIISKYGGISKYVVSIGGAVAHNVGQLIGAVIILQNKAVFYYLPMLLVCGIMVGMLTGCLLRFVAPYLSDIDKRFNI